MRLKLKQTEDLLKFTQASEMEDYGVWHVAENPIESDRTLCGQAHEGDGNAPYGVETFTRKRGRTITCEHCIAIIRLCRTL